MFKLKSDLGSLLRQTAVFEGVGKLIGFADPHQKLRLCLQRLDVEPSILGCAREAVGFGYGTLVLQSGEDYGISRDWLAEIVRRIKLDTPLAVTLSLGERPFEDLEAWSRAGADRYLLRFETSDPRLNQLQSNIAWGQRGNFLSIPTDCPQRDERLGWTGDAEVFVRAATYNADAASFFTKWLVDLEDAQGAGGDFFYFWILNLF